MNPTIPFRTEAEITHVVLRFQALDLPMKEWTHQAHLAVAMWHLTRYSLEEAICLLRSGIITYNASCGGKNTADSGYHETLTLFWIGAIDHFLERSGRERPLAVQYAELLASPYAGADLPYQYYSRERLFSVQARAMWAAPDLKPLEWAALRS